MTWLRRRARPLLVLYLVVLAAVLLSPSDSVQSEAIRVGTELLHRLGVAATSSLFRLVGFVENVLIIVPVSFLASLVRTRWTWRDWTALGFLAATTVETVQALFLSGRVATFADVVANTLGALLGALVARQALRLGADQRLTS